MSFKEYFKRLMIFGVILFAVLLIIKTYFFELVFITGTSMEPTYHSYQFAISNRISPTYERFSVVIVRSNGGNIIKRIIGLPGETVQIKNGAVYINGARIEDISCEYIEFCGIAEQPLNLGNGEYFLLGDNRNDSCDSRYKSIGIVTKAQLLGEVIT